MSPAAWIVIVVIVLILAVAILIALGPRRRTEGEEVDQVFGEREMIDEQFRPPPGEGEEPRGGPPIGRIR